MTVNRRVAALAAVSAVTLTLASCASSDREDSAGASGSGGGGDTITFGAAGAPAMFDPFYGTDGETFRPARQIFETLVDFKPGTADLAPGLATKWTPSNGGKTWTFDLQQNVKFTDGTAFNADAVCKNFTRMFDQNAAGQTAASYWADNMGGFKSKGAAEALYKSCTPKGANQVVIDINRPTSKFPALLGLPSFSMQSPTAMDKYKANNITPQGDGYTYSEYALKYPTGTGKFKLEKYDEANKTITMVRNDDYWGDKAKPARLVFKIIPDETARKQALAAGTIDGYDLPNPVDWPKLKQDENLQIRPAFNLLYLGLNPKANPDLKDLKVRQALMYGINRDQFVKTQLPENAVVATQWIPKDVDGFNKDVTKYNYDPNKAKQLLQQAGKTGTTVRLRLPSLPYAQSCGPVVKSMLEQVGFKVQTDTLEFPAAWLTTVFTNSDYDLSMVSHVEPRDLPTVFGDPDYYTHFSNPQMAGLLKAADTGTPQQETASMKKAARLIADDAGADFLFLLPNLIVADKNITGLPKNAITEGFDLASLGRS